MTKSTPWKFWKKSTSKKENNKPTSWPKGTFSWAWTTRSSSSFTTLSKTIKNYSSALSIAREGSYSVCCRKSTDSVKKCTFFLNQNQILYRPNHPRPWVLAFPRYHLQRVIYTLFNVVLSLKTFSSIKLAIWGWPTSAFLKWTSPRTTPSPSVVRLNISLLKSFINRATESPLTGGVWAPSSMKWSLDCRHSTQNPGLNSSIKSSLVTRTFPTTWAKTSRIYCSFCSRKNQKIDWAPKEAPKKLKNTHGLKESTGKWFTIRKWRRHSSPWSKVILTCLISIPNLPNVLWKVLVKLLLSQKREDHMMDSRSIKVRRTKWTFKETMKKGSSRSRLTKLMMQWRKKCDFTRIRLWINTKGWILNDLNMIFL